MGQQLKVTGIVLTAIPIGDFDKRLVIMTKEYGKISAFAKGARRPNSPYMAVCQPLSYGTFLLYEGRSSYNLNGAEIEEYFEDIKQELDSLYYAMYFCEMVDYLSPEKNRDIEMMKLLYISLKALGKDALPNPLVRVVFELRILAIYGLMPNVFQCSKCGKKEGLVYFSIERASVICDQCGGKTKQEIPLLDSTIYTMQYVLSQPIEKLYRFVVSENVLEQLQSILKQYREKYVNHTFKSLDFL